MMASRLLWLDDREPRPDAVLDPTSAQFHLWLAQSQHDHGNFGARELADMERRVGALARRARVAFNPFTGQFRRFIDYG
jgi:hypothetical protein